MQEIKTNTNYNQLPADNPKTLSLEQDTQLDVFDKLRKKPLLDVRDVQKILGIGRTSTYAYLNNNPPFRVLHINNSIRIPSSDLFRWLDGTGDSQ